MASPPEDNNTTTKPTKEALELPRNMRSRPIYNGFVVPYFVGWYKGDQQVNENEPGAKPSFPTTDYGRMTSCRKHNRCWICGNKLGVYKAFVFGPAGALARASYEPPSHRECARYAARVCPFLSNPNAKHVLERGNYQLKEGEQVLPDVAPHNPGVTVVWLTRRFEFQMQDRARGIGVFTLGEPESIEFYREGRRATYAETANAVNYAIRANGMMDDKSKMRELAWRVTRLLEWVNA